MATLINRYTKREASLQYNVGNVIAQQDVLSWSWEVAKDGSLKALRQNMGLDDGSIQYLVKTQYDARKNVTWIVRKPCQIDDDNEKMDDFYGKNPGVVKLPGVALLRLNTSQGHLVIEVPGL
jgi:hypothetical protein